MHIFEDSAADSLMSVFGEAAIASKGSATLIQIDCSTKEGKKVIHLILLSSLS